MTNNINSGEELNIQQIASGFQVVHATSGRLRLRTNDISLKPAVKTFAQILRQQEGIGEVQINATTGSLIVAFDKNKLSRSQILASIQQLGVSQMPAVEEKKTDYFAAWKSVDFWKEQGLDLIPLATGLAVTGGLGISGLAGIGVYMLTAGATRQAISLTKEAWLEVRAEEAEEAEEAEGAITNSKFKIQNSKLNHAPLAFPTPERQFDATCFNGGNPTPVASMGGTPTTHWLRNAVAPQRGENEPATGSSRLPTPYKIVHAVLGRVRFIVPRLAEDPMYAQRVQKLLKDDPAIAKFRLNRDAASIAINYKPSEGITVSHWLDLLHKAEAESWQQNNHAAMPTQKLELQQSVEEEDAIDITLLPQTDGIKATETTNSWAVMKSPALNLSLAFMANFPLQTVSE